MYLVVGGTGRLGSAVTRRLLASGKPVRVMTRDPSRGAALAHCGAEIVQGDVRDAASLVPACRDVERVLDAVQGLEGKGANTPRTVDGVGNQQLIDAARTVGARHFVFVSVVGARSDHPLEFWRMKYQT
jgi:uncharacterized protein YbjT (DUF2867 family)